MGRSIDQTASPYPTAIENHHIIQKVDAHDAKTAQGWQPQKFTNVPICLGEIFGTIALATF
jgi:hypothetical protein